MDTEPPKDHSQQEHGANPHNDSTGSTSATGGHGDSTPLDLSPEAVPTKEQSADHADQCQEQEVPPSLETETVTPEQ